MAEIRTVVSVVDRATAVLRSVARSTQQIVRQMENAGGATVSVLQQQRAYNRALSEGKRRAFSLTEQVRSMAAAYLSLRGIAEAISAMDRHASGQARLSLLVEEERKIRETVVQKSQKPPPQNVFAKIETRWQAGDALKKVQNLQKQIAEAAQKSKPFVVKTSSSLAEKMLRQVQEQQRKIGKSKEKIRIDSESAKTAVKAIEKVTQTLKKAKEQAAFSPGKESKNPAVEIREQVQEKAAPLPPVSSEKESLSLIHQQLERKKQLQDQIYAAAERSRGSYQNMVDVVSKLGILAKDSFSNSEEMIAFTEIMQKAFKVGGASAQEQAAAMYQLTQAMAAGKLQGDEFRSISESAPLLAQAIAKVTGKSMGDLKELSSKGLITADVMKAAMFSMADEVNAKFETLPLTFADIGIKVKNVAGKIFEDTINQVSRFLNSDMGSRLLQNITEDFLLIRQVVSGTLFVIGSVAGFFIQNWSMIRPVILAIAAALSLYKIAMMAAGAVTALTTLSHTAQAIAIAVHMGTTVADAAAVHGLTAAQWALNGALWACPLTWIVIGIMAVIAALYVGVAAHNHFAGASVSATGIVIGAFYVLVASLMNWIKMLINQFLAFAEFLANVYHHPLYSTKKLFANWAESIINIIRSVASAIDKVFGSNLAGALDSFKSTIHGWVGEMPKGYVVQKQLEMTGLEEAFAKGYEVGESLKAKFDLTAGIPSFEEMMNNAKMPQIPELSDIGKNAKKTADNTRGIKEELSAGDEELKWMRDIAAAEAVNRYSARNIHIEMQNTFGDIKETADVDGIIRKITEDLQESLSMEAEGAYDYV